MLVLAGELQPERACQGVNQARQGQARPGGGKIQASQLDGSDALDQTTGRQDDSTTARQHDGCHARRWKRIQVVAGRGAFGDLIGM